MATAGRRRREVAASNLVSGRVLLAVGGLAVLLVLALLGRVLVGSQDPAAPAYAAVPDSRLYAEVGGLRGVVDVALAYDDQAAPAAYTGTVTVAPGRRLCRVLDQVYAILRQGHHGAAIHVEVARQHGGDRPGRHLRMEDVDAAVAADPGARYGAQPGTGEPLDDRLCSPTA
ncbi:hypothetical protein [Nocardioides marmoribigeumensis]|uniref:CHRD domain-containing protein n=1 Tax=Nocardioides marmoribigeumensis TaxID=433649 RepID=A0ABU2BSD9_9ACTN|nr:hypothetical protein [Nocardioides marmoribigeumensis]MDR7361555.1 hypothetical protein [Nocardioides marmoribigeumensis]